MHTQDREDTAILKGTLILSELKNEIIINLSSSQLQTFYEGTALAMLNVEVAITISPVFPF